MRQSAGASQPPVPADGCGSIRNRIATHPFERLERLFERAHRHDLEIVATGSRATPLGRDLAPHPERLGTRNTSTPVCATADAFCRRPPIGADGPVEVDRAGHGDLAPASELALGQLVDQRQRECQAGRRTADRAGVDVELERQLDPPCVERVEPDDRALGILGRCGQRHLDVELALARTFDLHRHDVAGLLVGEHATEILDAVDHLAVDLENAITRVEHVVGRAPGRRTRCRPRLATRHTMSSIRTSPGTSTTS